MFLYVVRAAVEHVSRVTCSWLQASMTCFSTTVEKACRNTAEMVNTMDVLNTILYGIMLSQIVDKSCFLSE